MQVVVVDNDSGDGSAEALEDLVAREGWSAWASVLRSPRNGGFAAGNNLGIAAIDAEAYVLLNSDTLIEKGTFARLLDAMDREPRAGIIGPSMTDHDGTPESSHFRFLRPCTELVRAANTGPVTRLFAGFDPVMPRSSVPVESEWVGFACVLLRRAMIEEIGTLDEGYFMYFEDVDFCQRARKAGWKVLYWPDSRMVHLMGRSSSVTTKGGQAARAPRYYYEARARYLAKFYGRTGLLLANVLWCVGRCVSLLRQIGGRPPGLRRLEGLDIWTNCLRPIRSRQGGAA